MKKQYTYLIPLVLSLAFLLALAGCSDKGTAPQTEVQANLSMSIDGAMASELSRFVLLIADPEGDSLVAGPIDLNYDNGVVSGSVRVPADIILEFIIQAYDEQNVLVYSGSQLGRVTEQETVTLTINLTPVVPTLRLLPPYFAAERGQRFVLAVKIDRLPEMSIIEFGVHYDPALLSLDSTWMNPTVSNDISQFVVDSGNGGVSWYFDDYKPLADPPGPRDSDSITLGWMVFEVNPELQSNAATKVDISGISYAANDGQQTNIASSISLHGTEIDLSVDPTGRVPEVFILDPQEADLVGTVVSFRVQILDDGPIDKSDITVLYDGVRQPSSFQEIPETVNLYGMNFGVQFSQAGSPIEFQVEVTDADGNIGISEVRTVTYDPERQ